MPLIKTALTLHNCSLFTFNTLIIFKVIYMWTDLSPIPTPEVKPNTTTTVSSSLEDFQGQELGLA